MIAAWLNASQRSHDCFGLSWSPGGLCVNAMLYKNPFSHQGLSSLVYKFQQNLCYVLIQPHLTHSINGSCDWNDLESLPKRQRAVPRLYRNNTIAKISPTTPTGSDIYIGGTTVAIYFLRLTWLWPDPRFSNYAFHGMCTYATTRNTTMYLCQDPPHYTWRPATGP